MATRLTYSELTALDTPVASGYWEFNPLPPVANTTRETLEWIWCNWPCVAPAHRLGLVVRRGHVIGWTQRRIRYYVSRTRYRKRNAIKDFADLCGQPKRSRKKRSNKIA